MEVEAGMMKGHQRWKAEAEFDAEDKEFPLQQLLELVVESRPWPTLSTTLHFQQTRASHSQG